MSGEQIEKPKDTIERTPAQEQARSIAIESLVGVGFTADQINGTDEVGRAVRAAIDTFELQHASEVGSDLDGVKAAATELAKKWENLAGPEFTRSASSEEILKTAPISEVISSLPVQETIEEVRRQTAEGPAELEWVRTEYDKRHGEGSYKQLGEKYKALQHDHKNAQREDEVGEEIRNRYGGVSANVVEAKVAEELAKDMDQSIKRFKEIYLSDAYDQVSQEEKEALYSFIGNLQGRKTKLGDLAATETAEVKEEMKEEAEFAYKTIPGYKELKEEYREAKGSYDAELGKLKRGQELDWAHLEATANELVRISTEMEKGVTAHSAELEAELSPARYAQVTSTIRARLGETQDMLAFAQNRGAEAKTRVETEVAQAATEATTAPKAEDEIVPVTDEEMVFNEDETGILSSEEEAFLKERIPTYVDAAEELGKEREFENRVNMGNLALDQIDTMKTLRAEFLEKFPGGAGNFDIQIQNLNALAKECAGVTPREGAPVVAQAETEKESEPEIMDFTKDEEPTVAVAPTQEEVAPAPVVADEEAAEEVAAVSPENVGAMAEAEETRVEEAEPEPGTPAYYAKRAKDGLEGRSQLRSGERVPVEAAPKTDLATMENTEVINIVESKAGERPDPLKGRADDMVRWVEAVASTAETLGVAQGELINRYDLAKKAEPPAPAVAPVEEKETPVTTAPKAEPEVAIAPTPVAEETKEVAVVEEAPEEKAPLEVPKEKGESLYEEGRKLSMGEFAPWYLSLSQEQKDEYNREKADAKAAREREGPTAPAPAVELNPELAAQMESARKGEVVTGEETSGPRKGIGTEAVEIGTMSVGGGDREIKTAGPGKERKVTASMAPKREEQPAGAEFSLVWKPSEEEARILSSDSNRSVSELLSAYSTALQHSQRKVEVRTAPESQVKEEEIQAARDEVTYYQSAVDQIRKKL